MQLSIFAIKKQLQKSAVEGLALNTAVAALHF